MIADELFYEEVGIKGDIFSFFLEEMCVEL